MGLRNRPMTGAVDNETFHFQQLQWLSVWPYVLGLQNLHFGTRPVWHPEYLLLGWFSAALVQFRITHFNLQRVLLFVQWYHHTTKSLKRRLQLLLVLWPEGAVDVNVARQWRWPERPAMLAKHHNFASNMIHQLHQNLAKLKQIGVVWARWHLKSHILKQPAQKWGLNGSWHAFKSQRCSPFRSYWQEYLNHHWSAHSKHESRPAERKTTWPKESARVSHFFADQQKGHRKSLFKGTVLAWVPKTTRPFSLKKTQKDAELGSSCVFLFLGDH